MTTTLPVVHFDCLNGRVLDFKVSGGYRVGRDRETAIRGNPWRQLELDERVEVSLLSASPPHIAIYSINGADMFSRGYLDDDAVTLCKNAKAGGSWTYNGQLYVNLTTAEIATYAGQTFTKGGSL